MSDDPQLALAEGAPQEVEQFSAFHAAFGAWDRGPLLGFDLETTSPDPYTALPVSFALAQFNNQKMSEVRTGLIDPGIPIPAESTSIHGITDEMVKARGGSLEASVAGIGAILFEASARGTPVTGCNLSFDLTIINILHAHFFGRSLIGLGWCGPAIDVLVIDRHVDRYRRGKRTLDGLCHQYRVEAGGHLAAGDAIAATLVAIELSAAWKEVREMHPSELHEAQKLWHKGWFDHYNEYRVEQGEEKLDKREGQWPIRV